MRYHEFLTPDQVKHIATEARREQRGRLRRLSPRNSRKGIGRVYGVCLKACALRVLGRSLPETAIELAMPRVLVAAFDADLCDVAGPAARDTLREMVAKAGLTDPVAVGEFIQAQLRAGFRPLQAGGGT